jgi:outer membrane protein
MRIQFAKQSVLIALLLSATLTAHLGFAAEQANANKQNLLEIYQQALANDPVLKSADSANQAAQELIEQGKALYRPQVDFSAGASATRADVRNIGVDIFRNDGVNRFEGYEYGVIARQPIFRLQNWVQIDQSKTQVSQSDKQFALTKQQLILRVVQAYFQALITQDNIVLLQAQKEAVNGQLAQAKANFDVGNATITDYNEAKARFDLIEAQEIAAKNAHEAALYGISALTDQQPLSLASVNQSAVVQPMHDDLQQWVSLALVNNLGIQIQADNYTLAQQEEKRNAAGHLPTLDAVASYGTTFANGSANGFGRELTSSVIGVQLALPLYQGGAISSRTRQAALLKQQALENVEVAKRNATLETQTAYLNLKTNSAQVSAFEQAVFSSQSQLDSTKLGYQVGVRTSVDLLNAEQLLFSAKRDLLQARYNQLVSIIQLKTATGTVSELDLIEINQQLQ